MAVCFLVYMLQTAPRDLSEHGCHCSPALPERLFIETGPLERSKREVSGKRDGCLSTYSGIELDYVKWSTSSFTFLFQSRDPLVSGSIHSRGMVFLGKRGKLDRKRVAAICARWLKGNSHSEGFFCFSEPCHNFPRSIEHSVPNQ